MIFMYSVAWSVMWNINASIHDNFFSLFFWNLVLQCEVKQKEVSWPSWYLYWVTILFLSTAEACYIIAVWAVFLLLLWLQTSSFFKVKRCRAQKILGWVAEGNLLYKRWYFDDFWIPFILTLRFFNTFKNKHNMFSINTTIRNANSFCLWV